MEVEGSAVIGLDRPLQAGAAIDRDKLDRAGFARAAVAALRQVSSSSGFVLSIEGTWGSGKTSTLAMIEELLGQEPEGRKPLVVHFNPWLVGERDALLRLFLARMASVVKLTDHAKHGKKVANELKAYSKAFDVVKLIPGAEPWASIVKSVVASVGEATGAIAEHKAPDIERQKHRVEDALRQFQQRIIVFIDDMDRLFPLEVFEMVRIIKAVGDLPNVGYVLAWDPAYVARALQSASVPQPDTYLDKIVQVRMPLPGLSLTARETLINEALEALRPEALENHFPRSEHRLSMLYFSGLRDVLEQPRDVTRVFNTVGVIEPALRGEVVLSDIVGLAALMVKAPSVFELLRKNPRLFVGRLPGEFSLPDKDEDILKEGAKHREAAYSACGIPGAVQKMVNYLFPKTAESEGAFALERIVDTEGHLAAPARLLVALQLSVSPSDVSLVKARRYLLHATQREEIARSLNARNCLEFMEELGDVARSIEGSGIVDVEELCVSIARLADVEPFTGRAKSRSAVFTFSPEDVAQRAIDLLVAAAAPERGPAIAALVVEDKRSLTVATQIIVASYLSENTSYQRVVLGAPGDKDKLVKRFAENVIAAASEGTLLQGCNPGFILWNFARLAPSECPAVFDAIKEKDPSLDGFALEILRSSFDSHKGQAYGLPKEIAVLEAYCTLDALGKHAQVRLSDRALGYPARAAWKSVVEGKSFYGADGSLIER